MKPFSLEEYIKNPSKKVVTRDGRSARIICTNYTKAQHIIAQIEGNDYSISCHKDGIFINGFESNCDLFFVPEKREGWTNLYKWGKTHYPGKLVYPTKEEAKHAAILNEDYVDTIKIEWEE